MGRSGLGRGKSADHHLEPLMAAVLLTLLLALWWWTEADSPF